MAIILTFKGIYPKIDPTAFIAENAVVIGDVEIGAGSSIWYGCVIRGDVNSIRIGERTNIQDGTIVHVTRKIGPTRIGSNITIGHLCLLHACILEDNCFIGMGSTVMDFSVVNSNSWVAAGSLVTENKNIPSREMWAGRPAKLFRALKPEEAEFIPVSANNYYELGKEYLHNSK